MRKAAVLVLIALLSGCASLPCNEWQSMTFTAPPDKQEKEYVAAKSDCIEKTDASHPLRCVIGGAAAFIYWPKIGREYQDCMAEKGYLCKDDCAYEAGKK
ncbi:MAG: hypothetical protein Q7U03_10385 [Syntrophales bacterium]|nr:hypothetical protein [Syntrophales bacterium]